MAIELIVLFLFWIIIVYGTYEYPVAGWVGSANSGHLGLMAGYVKGIYYYIFSYTL